MAASDYDQAFLHRADQLITRVVAQLDQLDPDELEAEVAQGVVKIAFADGSRCVLNRQSAAQQMWLAEGASAWHFAHDAKLDRWIDTKGRGDLVTVLTSIIGKKLGRPYRLEL